MKWNQLIVENGQLIFCKKDDGFIIRKFAIRFIYAFISKIWSDGFYTTFSLCDIIKNIMSRFAGGYYG